MIMCRKTSDVDRSDVFFQTGKETGDTKSFSLYSCHFTCLQLDKLSREVTFLHGTTVASISLPLIQPVFKSFGGLPLRVVYGQVQ